MSEYLIFRLKSSGQRTVVGSFLVAATVALGIAGPATAWADDDGGLKAVPFEFVGKAGDCGTNYPAGSRIVTARWLRGMGLPDNGGPNFGSDPADNPNKKDPHRGLLLNKNGTTADCSSSGATIEGVKGMVVTSTFEVGYDYRNGGHCGAGAPRFNIDTNVGSSFVGGCSNGTQTPAPQDPLQWTRVRINLSNPAQSFPAIPVGSTVKSITLIFDEGTDTATNDTQGVGLAVLDNIFINGVLITREQGEGHHDGNDKDDDDKN
jgi:hypothetical protein